MERKYSRGRIGETVTTNEGYIAECVDGGVKKGHVLVKIRDYLCEVQYFNFTRGTIKYPYHPSVFGKGMYGVGIYKGKTHKKMYATWQSMLRRSYSHIYHKRQPTYKDVSVCEEWLDFQTFGKWFEENYVEGYALDKDLLVKGNKVYAPITCVFIPQRLNNFLTNIQSTSIKGFIGAKFHKRNKKWNSSINVNNKTRHLGTFDTKEEASKAYKVARAEQAELLKLKYKDVLPQDILDKIK